MDGCGVSSDGGDGRKGDGVIIGVCGTLPYNLTLFFSRRLVATGGCGCFRTVHQPQGVILRFSGRHRMVREPDANAFRLILADQ